MDEVCRLLDDPARVIAEYQRRLDAVQATPHRLELDALDRQRAKARRAIERLIDSYAEGLIEKPEFEPRLAELRRRTARLEAEAKAHQEAEEQVRSLQLVIGKLDLFAAMVRDRLEAADWSTKRDIICTLVKRIEVADDVVRVIFRVDPGVSGPSGTGRTLHHCPTRRHHAPDLDAMERSSAGRRILSCSHPFDRPLERRHRSSACRWKAVPRGTMDEVSSCWPLHRLPR